MTLKSHAAEGRMFVQVADDADATANPDPWMGSRPAPYGRVLCDLVAPRGIFGSPLGLVDANADVSLQQMDGSMLTSKVPFSVDAVCN